MSIFDNLVPSESLKDPWLWASPKVPRRKTHIGTKNGGKWLVFGGINAIDNQWEIIKSATEKGLLGPSSKVSTSMPNANAKNHAVERVICINTYDIEDIDNIREIREQLRKLGYNEKMPYKSDEATKNNLYAVNGDKGYSLFYE